MIELDTQEEKNAKCFSCGAGLSVIEHIYYGNRCSFCADDHGGLKIKLISFLFSLYLELVIHKHKQRLIRKFGYDKARFLFIGALGCVGGVSENFLTNKEKLMLIRELKNLKNEGEIGIV